MGDPIAGIAQQHAEIAAAALIGLLVGKTS
jgi:hypothetical protein